MWKDPWGRHYSWASSRTLLSPDTRVLLQQGIEDDNLDMLPSFIGGSLTVVCGRPYWWGYAGLCWGIHIAQRKSISSTACKGAWLGTPIAATVLSDSNQSGQLRRTLFARRHRKTLNLRASSPRQRFRDTCWQCYTQCHYSLSVSGAYSERKCSFLAIGSALGDFHNWSYCVHSEIRITWLLCKALGVLECSSVFLICKNV